MKNKISFTLFIICFGAVILRLIAYNMEVVENVVVVDKTTLESHKMDYKQENERLSKDNAEYRKVIQEMKEARKPKDKTKEEKERAITWERINKHLNTDNNNLNSWERYEKEAYLMSERIVNKTNIKLDALGFYRGFAKTVRAESANGANQINPKSDARGIIQFTKSYRNKHKIPHNINEYKMYNQIPFIEKYFLSKIKTQWTDKSKKPLNQSKIDEWFDVYMLVFAPAMADDEDDSITYRSPTREYKDNSGYDVNKNGLIERYEFKKLINDKYFN